MKPILILSVFFVLLFACKNPVEKNKTWQKILSQNNQKGVFALYDYGNETLMVSDISAFKDSLHQANNFSYFLASLFLIENGNVFDADKNYSINKKIGSLKQAFEEKDSLFFQFFFTDKNKKNAIDFLEKNQFKFKDTNLLQTNSMELFNQISLTLDQMLGSLSKFYFNKINIQSRSTDIAKQLFEQDSTIQLISFQLLQSQQTAFAGWIDKSGRPVFFVLLLNNNASITENKKRQILKQLIAQANF